MGTNAYTYDYDPIGNRLTASADAVTNLYAANALNQYTNILCASASLRLDYDLDGNLLTNGPWAYTWDAENRLASVMSNNVLVVTNVYDHLSRRIANVTGGTQHTFLYDGWNPVREISASAGGVSTNYYTWGLDLSGSVQGAGGVGGLLAVTTVGPNSLQPKVYFPAFDANGNVVQYFDATGGVAVAWTYDAFGRTVSETWNVVPETCNLPYRFSTKHFDPETGLYDYGFRFYSLDFTRFLNRDPILEEGGLNLYGFVGNDPVNRIDRLGLLSIYPVADSPRDKASQDGSLEWLWASVFIFFSDDEKMALMQQGGGYILHEKHTEIHIKNCKGDVVKDETQTVQKRVTVTATGLTQAYAMTTEKRIAPAYFNVANMNGYGKCVQGTMSVKAGWYLITGNGLPPKGANLKDDLSGSLDGYPRHGGIGSSGGWPSMTRRNYLSFGSLSVEVHMSCAESYSIHANGRNIMRGSLINRIDQYGEPRETGGTGYVW